MLGTVQIADAVGGAQETGLSDGLLDIDWFTIEMSEIYNLVMFEYHCNLLPLSSLCSRRRETLYKYIVPAVIRSLI